MQSTLFLEAVAADEALGLLRKALRPLIDEHSEEIDVLTALGRVTAEAVFARRGAPLNDCAAVDGIAVIGAKTRGAGPENPVTLRGGEFMPVHAGDIIAPPYDAVIGAEEVRFAEDGVTLTAPAEWEQNVHSAGIDVMPSARILPRGRQITPADIGLLLAGGVMRLHARKKPRVGILPAGSNVTEPDADTQGEIAESNSRVLEALVTQKGGIPARFNILPDEYRRIKNRLRCAVRRNDMALVLAGTGLRRKSIVEQVLRELGGIVAQGIGEQPLKSVILAVVEGRPVIVLPNYAAAVTLAFERFAAPVLADLTGHG